MSGKVTARNQDLLETEVGAGPGYVNSVCFFLRGLDMLVTLTS